MRSRSALLAWLLVAVSVVFVVGDTVLTAATSSLLSEEAIAEHGWPLVPGAALGSSLMGALIVSSTSAAPGRLAAGHRGSHLDHVADHGVLPPVDGA